MAGLAGLLGLLQPGSNYSGLNALGSILGLYGNQQATKKAEAQNQAIATSASNIIGGGSGGNVSNAGLLENGVPSFDVNLKDSTNVGYNQMLSALQNAQGNNASSFQGMMSQLLNSQTGEQGGLLNAYNTSASGLRGTLGGLQGNQLSEFDREANSVSNAARARQDQGMGMLEGYGNQQIKDLNTQYNAAGNAAQMSAAQRGFGSGNLAQGASRANERERADALARTNESINTQKLNTYSSLSGDVLNTLGTNFANRTNMLGNQASNTMSLESGLANNLLGLQGQQSTDRTNLLSSLLGQQYNTGAGNQSAIANLEAQRQGTLMGLDTTAAANALNLTSGVNAQYPSMSAYDLMSQMGGAYGANQQNVYAQNQEDRMHSYSNWAPWAGMGYSMAGNSLGALSGAGMGRGVYGQ